MLDAVTAVSRGPVWVYATRRRASWTWPGPGPRRSWSPPPTGWPRRRSWPAAWPTPPAGRRQHDDRRRSHPAAGWPPAAGPIPSGSVRRRAGLHGRGEHQRGGHPSPGAAPGRRAARWPPSCSRSAATPTSSWDLAPEDYDGATPDGRPPTPEFAAERLARVVCADGEMLDAGEIRGHRPGGGRGPGRRDRRRDRGRWPRRLPPAPGGRGRPAWAASWPGAPPSGPAWPGGTSTRCWDSRVATTLPPRPWPGSPWRLAAFDCRRHCQGAPAPKVERPSLRPPVAWVIKIGGSLSGRARRRSGGSWRRSAGAARRRRARRGPRRRAAGRRRPPRWIAASRLGDTAAHWMAILAMDQYAHLLARLAGDAAHRPAPARAPKAGRLNVLAPLGLAPRRRSPAPLLGGDLGLHRRLGGRRRGSAGGLLRGQGRGRLPGPARGPGRRERLVRQVAGRSFRAWWIRTSRGRSTRPSRAGSSGARDPSAW